MEQKPRFSSHITDRPKRQTRQKYTICEIHIDVYVHSSHLKGNGFILYRQIVTYFTLFIANLIYITCAKNNFNFIIFIHYDIPLIPTVYLKKLLKILLF